MGFRAGADDGKDQSRLLPCPVDRHLGRAAAKLPGNGMHLRRDAEGTLIDAGPVDDGPLGVLGSVGVGDQERWPAFVQLAWLRPGVAASEIRSLLDSM